MDPLDLSKLMASAPMTIAAALPTLSAFDLGMEASTPVRDVVSASNFRERCARFAGLLSPRASTRIGDALPGLAAIANARLEPSSLPTRIANRVDKLGWRTWADVADATPERVAVEKAVGPNTILELFALAVEQSLRAIARAGIEPVPSEDSLVASNTRAAHATRTSLPSMLRDSLAILARWSGSRGSTMTLGEAFAYGDLPPDVAAAASRLNAARLADLSEPPHQPDVGRVARLLATVGDAARDSIRGRAPPAGRDTLEEVARRRGITKERVRQIEDRARDDLLSRLGADEFAEVRWDVEHLRRGLGLGVFVGIGVDPARAVAFAMPTDAAGWAGGDLDAIFWLAGPYRLDGDGWLRRDALPEPSAADPFIAADGRVDLPALRGRLSTLGMIPSAIDAWLERAVPIRACKGVALAWRGTIADKLSRVLAVHDEPADVDSLLALAGESHSTRSVRNQLLGDERFVRTDLDRFGLRAWGLDEYAGIAIAIAEELRHRGEDGGDLADVVRAVASRFSARPASVRAYADAPMFVVSEGRIRLRREDEPPAPAAADLDENGDLERLGSHGIAVSFDVDADALRGSGRPARSALAAWAGVAPDGNATFKSSWGDLRITWPMTSPRPSIGSLRAGLVAIGATPGTRVRLLFDRASHRWHLERRDAIVDVARVTAASIGDA